MRHVDAGLGRSATFVLASDIDPIGQYIVDNGCCPPQPLQDLLLHLLRPGDYVVDVGAHIGALALRAAARGAHVMAIEAGADNLAHLRTSLEANPGFDVRLLHAAAGHLTGRLAFGPRQAWGHVRRMIGDDIGTAEVTAVTVDEAVDDAGWDHVDIVKINVEGWEGHVLAGMRALLSRPDAPLVFLQSNALAQQGYGHTPTQVFGMLAAAGYTLFLLDPTRPQVLVEWRADVVQTDPIADFVAWKTPPAGLDPWHLTPSLTLDELVSRLATTSTHAHGPYRGYPALALREAPEALLADPRILEMCERLRDLDPDPGVRETAAWTAVLAAPDGVARWMAGNEARRTSLAARPLRDPYLTASGEAGAMPGSELFREVTLPGGATVTFVSDGNPTDIVSQQLVDHGLPVEDPPVAFALTQFAPGRTFVDLGAHVGTFSLTAAALGARVLAIEGSSRNAGLLRRAAERSGLRQIELVNAVVSGSAGPIAFSPHFAWGHVRKVTEEDTIPSVQAEAVTLDETLETRGFDRVDFLKMDIEGWEVEALPGMARLLGRPDAPTLLFECNGPGLAWYGRTPVDLLTAVATFGYTVYLIDRAHPARLVRWAPGTLQPDSIGDYVAVKSADRLPPGWDVAEPLTVDELAARFLATCDDANSFYRAYAAVTLREATEALLARPDIADGLRRLRLDPDDDVRAQAAWSGSLDPPFGIAIYLGLHRHVLDDCRRRRRACGPLPAGMASLPDPYIVRRQFSGIELDVLIADVTARAWYEARSARFVDLDAIRELKLIAPGDVVFDVGAHQGIYSLCFARWAGPTGHVFSFELLRPNCDIIEANARLNGLSNITVIHAAVGDRTGTARAERATTSVSPGETGDEVPALRLDDLIDKRPRFIKIDAEGFEGFVLKGAHALLETVPNLAIEIDARSRERFGMSVEETAALVDWTKYDTWSYTYGAADYRRWRPRERVNPEVALHLMARRRRGWFGRWR